MSITFYLVILITVLGVMIVTLLTKNRCLEARNEELCVTIQGIINIIEEVEDSESCV
ncbi:MAG: hypothetical protein KAJ03_00700 [Gammaproteobacteria bacterium]|nr:hypothetical protein [Gammaproteobacteria bacterium]